MAFRNVLILRKPRGGCLEGRNGTDPVLSQLRSVEKGGVSASIIVVNDEPDVADLFRQCFRREARHGLQLLGEIKKRFPGLPVMMVTAYGDEERRRRAGELGAAEFLTKPVDFALLKAQLRQLPAAG
jgi:DNA-binding NarL/FixJ family response regulator